MRKHLLQVSQEHKAHLIGLTQRATNTSLRVFALASSFFLVLCLARYITPAELGTFGLLTVTITLSVLFIGADHYTYSSRKIISHPKEQWLQIITSHAFAVLPVYAVFLTLLLSLSVFGLIPDTLTKWLILITSIEFVSQEINRLLIAMRRPIFANLVFFIRVGAWAWVVILLFLVSQELRSLQTVLIFWALGSTLAAALGGYKIAMEVRPAPKLALDWISVKDGYMVALYFFMGTILLKTITTADRFIVQYLAGEALLGVYVFYITFSMGIVRFLDPAIFQFLYPRLIVARKNGDIHSFRRTMRELFWSSVGVGGFLAFALASLMPILLIWVSRPLYLEHIQLLWILLAMNFFHGLGMVAHYGLYALHADKEILFCNFCGFLIFFAVLMVIQHFRPIEATALALFISFLSIAALKYLHLLKYIKSTSFD